MILKPAALLAAFVALTFAGTVLAADPVNIEIMAVEEQPGSMILTVSAVDENGQPFPGLDPSNFNAWINDTPLIVKELHTETDREPASVLLLVDVSGSMAGERIQQAQLAINEFIGVLEPNDQVALMTFSSGVNLVQDFTSDHGALQAAVANFQLTNDTALYDGVIEAAAKMSQTQGGRKLIVLLSDGQANIGLEKRDASIAAARDAGIGFVSVGLGAGTDRQYLGELSKASGGALIEAATPPELRQAFTNLAFAIRSQYTLVTEVPRSIDRTVPGTLKVHVIHRADSAFAERSLDSLAGAVPPPFTMAIDGITPGEKHNGQVELIPTVQEGIEVAKVDYYLDDQLVSTAEGLGNYTLDASQLENGSHVLKVVATDTQGREGEVQVPFLVPVLVAPSQGKSLPILPLLILALLLGVGFVLFRVLKKRFLVMSTPTYSRVDNWASIRTPGAGPRPEEWPEGDDSAHPLSRPSTPPASTDQTVVGRVVIMDEAAVRGGELETIREFEMKSSPMTFGSGPNADMRVGDAGGTIAAEEARVWVQRGRLVYHKLTTLSAMATEGVTAGWQFLDDGDEMRVGPYRIIFQAQQPELSTADDAPLPDGLPQEHGMALHRSFGLTETDRSPDLQEWANEQGPSASNQETSETRAVEPDAAAGTPPGDSEWEDSTGSDESSVQASDWGDGVAGPPVFNWDANGSPPAPVWEGEPMASLPEDEESAEPESPDRNVDVASQPASSWSIEPLSQSSVDMDEPEGPESPDASAGESQPPVLSEGDDDASPDSSWNKLMEEPKSADWIVEQSQPVDDGADKIVQPDSWNTFVSADDVASNAVENDEPDEDDRAWGT
jgi:VWFA-related protein